MSSNKEYIFPSYDLLTTNQNVDSPVENHTETMNQIVSLFAKFGIEVRPKRFSSNGIAGRYVVELLNGVRFSKIEALEDDFEFHLNEKIRILKVKEASTFAVEIPLKCKKILYLKEVFESPEWKDNNAILPIALGKDIEGNTIVKDLTKLKHILIGGLIDTTATIYSIITSLLYKCTPTDLRFIMHDPKTVELPIYNKLPHMLSPVITDVSKLPAVLSWLVDEMEKRYRFLTKYAALDIEAYNTKQIDEISNPYYPKMPYIVCVIDEIAHAMVIFNEEIELSILRLLLLGHTVGIHLIIATQRTDSKIILERIQKFIPTKISRKLRSKIDSEIIFGEKGAEKLYFIWEMIFKDNETAESVRVNNAYGYDEEIESVVKALKVNGAPIYSKELLKSINLVKKENDNMK